MSDVVIRVENIGKLYRIGQRERYRALRDVLARSFTLPFRSVSSVFRRSPSTAANPRSTNNYFWALKDVSFEVKRGEIVGIIGRNGAGKSTLLKILSRITEPTEGYAEIHGRVGSLLEVGTGFHPELTGRENIYLNGAILGMKKHEIDRKFDEIVAFAEVEKFIDTPVKYYSSGMYVRLAFSVAAHLEPEILMIDEVLAVGDAAFQKKCLGKMGDVAKEGRTVLFVSHNMPSIQSLCNRALLLRNGTIVLNDYPDKTITKYLSLLSDNDIHLQQKEVDLTLHPGRSKYREIAIKKAWIENNNGEKCRQILMGSSVNICYYFECKNPIVNPNFGFGIEDIEGKRVFSLNNSMLNQMDIPNSTSSGVVCYHIPSLPLLPGRYLVSLSILEGEQLYVDYIERAFSFNVEAADVYRSGKIPHKSHGIIFASGKIFLRKPKII